MSEEMDFADDFVSEEEEDESPMTQAASAQRQLETRRKIEDILERRRLREEFGDLDF